MSKLREFFKKLFTPAPDDALSIDFTILGEMYYHDGRGNVEFPERRPKR